MSTLWTTYSKSVSKVVGLRFSTRIEGSVWRNRVGSTRLVDLEEIKPEGGGGHNFIQYGEKKSTNRLVYFVHWGDGGRKK